MSFKFEAARQEHIRRYGSFLHCPERKVLCSFMEESWKTGNGCSRTPCILDDPDYIRMRRIQEEKARLREEKQEADRTAAPIRRQTKSRTDILADCIVRLEKESADAYRRNRPRVGEAKLQEAMILRGELRKKG